VCSNLSAFEWQNDFRLSAKKAAEFDRMFRLIGSKFGCISHRFLILISIYFKKTANRIFFARKAFSWPKSVMVKRIQKEPVCSNEEEAYYCLSPLPRCLTLNAYIKVTSRILSR
jgi:hypothetical protein